MEAVIGIDTKDCQRLRLTDRNGLFPRNDSQLMDFAETEDGHVVFTGYLHRLTNPKARELVIRIATCLETDDMSAWSRACNSLSRHAQKCAELRKWESWSESMTATSIPLEKQEPMQD